MPVREDAQGLAGEAKVPYSVTGNCKVGCYIFWQILMSNLP